MDRAQVTSSRIRTIGFENDIMEIEFSNGRVYQYKGPRVRDHYHAMMAADLNGESVGRYFNQHVRRCLDTVYWELEQPATPSTSADKSTAT